ncbi:MAG: ABC transporter ATP-binding protein [bacterium]|nr:ABC transporter ATP-binding protein [bacterium]
MDPSVLLEVRNLRAHFFSDEGTVRAVDGVNFQMIKGETLGVVGESGCGKSVTSQAILQILPKNGKIIEGEILFDLNGKVVDLAQLKPNGKEIRKIRGKEISIMFQEPMTCLSPVHTIGNQIEEGILLHRNVGNKEAREMTIDMLRKCGIPEPERRVDAYPHQLSGGMRQRAMIAMSLACRPRLLIADEPTTALDVTTQAQILDLLKELQQEIDTSIMLITHNLGVVAELADHAMVMYLGKVVEFASVDEIFNDPKHPYTRALLKSIPKLGRKSKERLLSIEGSIPNPYELPSGCKFHPRCPDRIPGVCDRYEPELTPMGSGHTVSCFLYSEPVLHQVEDATSAF